MTTIVSYQGGSAGDLLTASLNNIELDFNQRSYVKSVNFTLKGSLINDVATLVQTASNNPWPYLSTHDVEIVKQSNLSWINVQVSDPEIQKICVWRQMSIQHLFIDVDDSSHWYKIVKSLCTQGKYHEAANYWFLRSEKLWIDEMNYRLSIVAPLSINFNNLFSDDFYKSIVNQQHNIPLLEDNHKKWLVKNSINVWSKESTINIMSTKLSKMDWSQTNGTIKYYAV